MDSSVFVAILSDEDDAADFLFRLQNASAPVTSGLVILETVMRLTSKLKVEPSSAMRDVDALLEEAGITVMAIDEDHGRLAIEAFARYGKGRGHPAQLN
ncbi:MAG: PIN domain-containing protein, partial [Pararhizobium sp.]